MSIEKIVKLNYIEDGTPKSEEFLISFIANNRYKDYDRITKLIDDFNVLRQEISDMQTMLGAVETEKAPDYEKKADEITAQVKALVDKCMSFDKYKIPENRRDLIIKILVANQVTGKFVWPDFWDENVDVADAINFLEELIYKDLKKKAVN